MTNGFVCDLNVSTMSVSRSSFTLLETNRATINMPFQYGTILLTLVGFITFLEAI